MTDKELKKLSRLELLELLLEVSKENEQLKEKIEKLKIENKTAQSIENLSVATHQIETALKYANSLTGTLKAAPQIDFRNDLQEDTGDIKEIKEETEDVKEEVIEEAVKKQKKAEKPPIISSLKSDREIYRRILCFFAINDDKLNVFPADIRKDVRVRIKSILESRN